MTNVKWVTKVTKVTRMTNVFHDVYIHLDHLTVSKWDTVPVVPGVTADAVAGRVFGLSIPGESEVTAYDDAVVIKFKRTPQVTKMAADDPLLKATAEFLAAQEAPVTN